MAVLVRWRQGSSVSTLRASALIPDPLLPSHVRLVGVRGLADDDHPDLRVVSLTLRRRDVEYVCEAVAIESSEPEVAIELDDTSSEASTDDEHVEDDSRAL